MEIKDRLLGREFKDYRLTEKLGGGAFGAVYRAEHTRLSKSFAVKILHPHIADNKDIVTRFRREAQSLASLDHPNIVQIIDFDQDEEMGFYLILEWLKGDALNTVLKREGQLPMEQVINLFQQLMAALSVSHEQGIIHRDLKPANLMILASGQGQVLKVLDYGIAAMEDGNHDLTSDGTAMGSANYMSPEQALGKIREIDNRSDLYSCGIILGKCLTGRNIFPADSPTQILWKHIYEPPPRLNDIYPEGLFPESLEEVFAKSIAKDKEDRFQSAEEFSQALTDVLLELRHGMSQGTPPPASVTPKVAAPAFQTPNAKESSSRGVATPSRGAAVATPSPVSAARHTTEGGLSAHTRAPGRSSSSLGESSTSSSSRFASFSSPRSSTVGEGSTSTPRFGGVGEGSTSTPRFGGVGEGSTSTPRFGGATIRAPKGLNSLGQDVAVGDASASMSSGFGSNSSQRSPIRPKLRGGRPGANRPSGPGRPSGSGRPGANRAAGSKRPIRSARKSPEVASKGGSSGLLWALVGLIVVAAAAGVWFFVLADKGGGAAVRSNPDAPVTRRKDDNFWKNLEKEASKKRPNKRR